MSHDNECGYSKCPAPSVIVMHVMGGEVHLCGTHARAGYPLDYPAFWKGHEGVVFDKENFWRAPVLEEQETSVPDYVDDEDDEEEDEDD